MTTEDTIAELNGLIQTCRTANWVTRSAAADVRNTELETVFTEYAKQRGQFAQKLQAEVERLGGKPGGFRIGRRDTAAGLDGSEVRR